MSVLIQRLFDTIEVFRHARGEGEKPLTAHAMAVFLKVALAGEEGISQADLQTTLGMGSSTITRNVSALEKRRKRRRLLSASSNDDTDDKSGGGLGWIHRGEDEDDRRFNRLRLTPRGKRVLDELAMRCAGGH